MNNLQRSVLQQHSPCKPCSDSHPGLTDRGTYSLSLSLAVYLIQPISPRLFCISFCVCIQCTFVLHIQRHHTIYTVLLNLLCMVNVCVSPPGISPAPSNWNLDAEAGSYMPNPGTLTMPHGSSRTFPQGNEHTQKTHSFTYRKEKYLYRI